MPHNHMSGEELSNKFPSPEVVDDADIPDLSRLEDDSLYAAGMEVVQAILREMAEVGRTRSYVAPSKLESSRGVRKVDRSGYNDVRTPTGPAELVSAGLSWARNSAADVRILDRPAELDSVGQPSVDERKDRSGYGQGGDRSGRADVNNDFRVCAVYEPNHVDNEHECSTFAHFYNRRPVEPRPSLVGRREACHSFSIASQRCYAYGKPRFCSSCHDGPSEGQLRCRRFRKPPSPRRSVGFHFCKLIYHAHDTDACFTEQSSSLASLLRTSALV